MITTAHVYAILFIHVGVILVATAYYTMGAALLPGVTGRAAHRFAGSPGRVLLVGVACSVPWVAVSVLLLSRGGPLGLVGGTIGAAWLLTGLLGGAGIAEHVGRRGEAGATWRSTARGGLVIALTWALPIIGWLIVLPASIAAGVGCALLARRPVRQPTPPPAPAPEGGSPVAA
jgi:hypothetical protein